MTTEEIVALGSTFFAGVVGIIVAFKGGPSPNQPAAPSDLASVAGSLETLARPEHVVKVQIVNPMPGKD